MIVAVIQSEGAKALAARLASWPGRVQMFHEPLIEELTHESAGLIYLFPEAVTHSEAWPKLRVRLAMANRFFVVAGSNLSTAEVMAAARDGAFDVLDLADDDRRWHEALAHAAQSQETWLKLYGGSRLDEKEVLIGRSPAIKGLRQTIDRLGPTDASVLIKGESGVGKEKVAAALHRAGRSGPFVAFNCAAVPKDLLEAELFGVEKGAFTGANKNRPGLVEQADGGVLFLDEVGELELALQPKLLRFLETRVARRVGGEKEYRVRLRLVSATNRNLTQSMADGSFRADLYYRLSEVVLDVPPLRTRPEDIPELARLFLSLANERFGKNVERIEPELIQKFQASPWPGNVRELKSAIDRLVLLYDGPILRAGWWNPIETVAEPATRPTAALPTPAPAPSEPSAPTRPLSRRQRLELAQRLLDEKKLSLAEVAAQVGVHSSTLFRWRKSSAP